MTVAATTPTSTTARRVPMASHETHVRQAAVVRRELLPHEGAVASRLVADTDPVVAVDLALTKRDDSPPTGEEPLDEDRATTSAAEACPVGHPDPAERRQVPA